MNDKKTIAFVIYSLSSGGAERVVSILSNALTSTYNVVIITFVKTSPFYKLNEDIKIVHCSKESSQSKSTFEAIRSNYKFVKKIYSFLKNHNVDLCVGFMTRSNILSTIAAKLKGIPIIISERNNPYAEDYLVPKFWKILRKLTYPRVNYLVVQTQTIKNYYSKFIKDTKLKTIPNPLNPDFYEYEELERKNVILNVGRLSDQKAQDLLIKAFAEVNPKNWELHIVGEGENRASLENIICDLKMEEKIKLLGRRADIHKHYRTSKIFAFTSQYEGFPNALIEAMHFKLACVSTDCPTGPSELITNGKNGFLIPINNQNELQEKLLLLINDKNKRIKLGEEAKIKVSEYKIEVITNKWIQIFNKIIK